MALARMRRYLIGHALQIETSLGKRLLPPQEAGRECKVTRMLAYLWCHERREGTLRT
jgi:hypothetical protein